MTKYLLITGATGLLGEYVLCDLTLQGVPLAVVARSSGRRSAVDRVEDIFSKLERQARRGLRRPVVLEGDLHQPLLGLSDSAVSWVGEHCDRLLHNAASLQFIEDPKSGEPYRSNVAGTEHMLELCRQAGIRHLHHVSTAYVCGTRRGLISESAPLDPAQAGNDYESSKIQSEQMVRDFEPLDSLVVYRPAIIVGDQRSGYTSTFHGFYVPLQLCHAIRGSSVSQQGLPPEMLLHVLGLTGQEQKNFVPVDWVSAAITRGLVDRSDRFRGRTIHLAPRRRVSVSEMTEALVEALTSAAESSPNNGPSGTSKDPEQLLEFFHQQMRVYQAYWRDDPEFEGRAVSELMPDLPCPDVDRASMLRLCRYALRTNFGARKGVPPEHPVSVGETLRRLSVVDPAQISDEQQLPMLGCCVTGPGGGDYALHMADGKVAAVSSGLPASAAPCVRMNRSAWDQLVSGELAMETALLRGRVMLFAAQGDQTREPASHDFAGGVQHDAAAALGALFAGARSMESVA